MKKLLSIIALSVCLPTLLFAQGAPPIQRNYFTTNAAPVQGGATNGIQINGGVGTNNVLYGLTVVNPAVQWPANSATATKVTNSFTVRVSSRGLANSLATVENDGANFGPDTAGTTTMGIQEAWNSFNKGTNYGPLIAPMAMKFTDGFFYYTNRIVISNLFTSAIMWKGDSMLGSTLVYAGSTATTNTILFNAGVNTNAGTLSLPLHIQIENLTFTALTNSTNVLLELKGFSYANLQHLNFTSWNVRTNQGTGSGVSMFGTAATYAPGLVGLYLNNGSLEHAVVMNDIFFAGLACGMRANSDHIEATGIRGAQIGYTVGGATNIWPSTNIYSLGACVIREGGYNSSWRGLHIYSTHVGFAAVGNGDAPLLDSIHFEGCDYPVVSDKETIAPVVRDPRNVSGTLESFFAYKLFTPTSATYTSTNGLYAPTFQDHPAAVAYGSWPYINGADYYRFFVFLTNRPSFWVDGNGVTHGDGSGLTGIASTGGLTNVESRAVVFTNGLTVAKSGNTNLTVASDGVLVSAIYFGAALDFIAADGSASFQGGTTLFQANGNVDLVGGALHVEPTKMILATGVTGYGNANGFTNGSPALATNNAAATDGMVLSKTGDKLKLIAAGAGSTYTNNSSDFPGVVNPTTASIGTNFNAGAISINVVNAATLRSTKVGNTNAVALYNANGEFTNATLGAGLSLSGTTLNSSAGSASWWVTNVVAAGYWTNYSGGSNILTGGKVTFHPGTDSVTYLQTGAGEMSSLAGGLWFDNGTVASTYFIGDATGSTSPGDFNLNAGTFNGNVAFAGTINGNGIIVTNISMDNVFSSTNQAAYPTVDFSRKRWLVKTNDNIAFTGYAIGWNPTNGNATIINFTNNVNPSAVKTVVLPAWAQNMNPAEGNTLYLTNVGQLLIWGEVETGTNFYWKSR